MTYRITRTATTGEIALANDAGDLARKTDGAVYLTQNPEHAQEALDFLNQPASLLSPRKGSHRLKSMFGKA